MTAEPASFYTTTAPHRHRRTVTMGLIGAALGIALAALTAITLLQRLPEAVDGGTWHEVSAYGSFGLMALTMLVAIRAAFSLTSKGFAQALSLRVARPRGPAFGSIPQYWLGSEFVEVSPLALQCSYQRGIEDLWVLGASATLPKAVKVADYVVSERRPVAPELLQECFPCAQRISCVGPDRILDRALPDVEPRRRP